MPNILTAVVSLVLVAQLVACGQSKETPVVSDEHTPNAPVEPDETGSDIEWFQGSVDAAFAHARAEQKPIFLYWGAVWCPPCHEIKVTVFDTSSFVERSRLFVPVYLDGDTDNAQEIGERFGVLGYPTMIVFSPDGTEITRIPGGIDIQAYANVLDLTLQNARPVSDLLAGVLDNDDRLSANDCRLVAFYSWGQNKTILEDRDQADVFRRLYEACPVDNTVERSRLYLDYLGQAIDAANRPDKPIPLSDEQVEHALGELHVFVDSYVAVKANLYSALLDGAKLTAALTESGSADRANLTKKYLATLERIASDESVFTTERLYTAIGKMRFERIDDPEAEISDDLKAETRKLIAWADRATPDVYARQTVMNGASNVLNEAGMNAEARAMLETEIKKSNQPYYFMVSLADVEQADGNYDLAIELLEQAYAEATGPATRFQWGTY
ncbi:MAG: thioredoxin family protein [Gammaproteobacteria bacterium]|nr:thioredoxin family protein [Gammaproteobacteria bacterium]